MNRYLWLVVGSLLVVGAGCVVRAQPAPVVVAPDPGPQEAPPPDYGPTYPSAPPPAPIVEYRPAPPGYGYFWVDGYWDWTGYDWAWTNGYYVPERSGYIYSRPRYVYEGNRWVYHQSYWEGPDHRRDYVYGRPAPVGRGGAPRTVYNQPRGGAGFHPAETPRQGEFGHPNNGPGFHATEPAAQQHGFGQPANNGAGFHATEPAAQQHGFGQPAGNGAGFHPTEPAAQQHGFGQPNAAPGSGFHSTTTGGGFAPQGGQPHPTQAAPPSMGTHAAPPPHMGAPAAHPAAPTSVKRKK